MEGGRAGRAHTVAPTSTPHRSRYLRSALTAGALLVALLSGLVGTSATASTPTQEESGESMSVPSAVISLGDSYSSGLGSGDYTNDCDHTPNAWPNLIFDDAVTDRTLLACSGARIAEVQAQVEQLSDMSDGAGGRLITVTVGGNDAGFADDLPNCLVSFSSCTTREDEIRNRIHDLQGELTQVYRDTQAAAPGDTVIVGGYPLLVPDPAVRDSCRALTFAISNAEREMIRRLGRELNDVIAAAADEAGVIAVGTALEEAFDGHEACSNGDTDWLYGLRITTGSAASADPGTIERGDIAVQVRADVTSDELERETRGEDHRSSADPLATFVRDSFHPTVAGQIAYAAVFADAWNQR